MGLLSPFLKEIKIFHADAQNEGIPATFHVCDGTLLNSSQQDINPGSTYQLPDLRNMFLLGGDITKAASTTGDTANSASSAPGPKGAGGANAVVLTTSNLPAHTHTASTDSQGAHTHTGSVTDTQGAHIHAGSSIASSGSHNHGGVTGGSSVNVYDQSAPTFGLSTTGSGPVNQSTTHTHTIAADGSHTHTLTIVSDGGHVHNLSIVSDGAHTHNVTVNSTGSGTSFDNRPRYYGVIYIMKVQI